MHRWRRKQSSTLPRWRPKDHFVTRIVASPRRQIGVRRFENCARSIFWFVSDRSDYFRYSLKLKNENSGFCCFGEHLRTSRLLCGTRRLFGGGIRSLVSGVGLLTMSGPRVFSKCPINSEGICPSFDQGNRSRGGGNEVFVASGAEGRLGTFASVQERVADALGIRARVGAIVWSSATAFLFPRLGATFETWRSTFAGCGVSQSRAGDSAQYRGHRNEATNTIAAPIFLMRPPNFP
jgi:hypothetical protein